MKTPEVAVMLFPVSGVECSPIVPFAAALLISFATSMAGVSGAFLLLPFQMSVLGYTSPGVSATNHLFNILACPGGVWRFWREGRLLWPLAGIILKGTLPGALLGAVLRVYWLPDPRGFKFFAGLLLLVTGWRFLGVLRRGGASSRKPPAGAMPRVLRDSPGELRFAYDDKEYGISRRSLWLLCLGIGLAGGMYGVGGGSLLSPFLTVFFHLPVHATAGAVLLGTLGTSLFGVLGFVLLSGFVETAAPDWLLGLSFGLGGMCGMYLGARCQKYVSSRAIGWGLAAILLFTAIRYLGQSLWA